MILHPKGEVFALALASVANRRLIKRLARLEGVSRVFEGRWTLTQGKRRLNHPWN
jgi:hypothetical protein